MEQDLANEIELSVLAFLQDRRGFDEWWHSMDSTTQNAIELNLIDCIAAHTNKPVPVDGVVECWYCHRKYGKGHKCCICGREGR